jgi:hypothetical protein
VDRVSGTHTTVLPGGRIGLPGSNPVEHTPVAPTLVVEIETDTAFEAGRCRHGVKFLRIRAELRPADLPFLPRGAWSS